MRDKHSRPDEKAMVFGPGQTENTTRQSDVWIGSSYEGESTVTMDEKLFKLKAGDSLLIHNLTSTSGSEMKGYGFVCGSEPRTQKTLS
ncbi:hypothetical protein WMY93_018047 [Mugilogobius chulae]|uniref:Uncharacterized protein n=1 Tax=Mugilogobius chulae TaxID=88201 RepID=A0AAW0NIX2_9GOBI